MHSCTVGNPAISSYPTLLLGNRQKNGKTGPNCGGQTIQPGVLDVCIGSIFSYIYRRIYGTLDIYGY